MIRYRREIDGLRAVAVVPVVLYHSDVAGFSGGFLRIDVNYRNLRLTPHPDPAR